jgi:hypothetical protein
MKELLITYRYTGENPQEVADSIRVEQTIEFPYELAPAWIQADVVGDIVSLQSFENTHTFTIAFSMSFGEMFHSFQTSKLLISKFQIYYLRTLRDLVLELKDFVNSLAQKIVHFLQRR